MDFYELKLWKYIMHDISFKNYCESNFFVYKKEQ